jgi:sirohydrochlorin ferrochelatase
MTDEMLLLVGRAAPDTREVGETHARRLKRRGVVDDATVACYEQDPERELADELAVCSAETVYAAPLTAAHTHETATEIPAALRHVPSDVAYLDPVGREPAITDVIAERAAERLPPVEPTSLALVGFGNSARDSGREVVEYHARRLREHSDYAEVTTSYLLQNPAVECARYGVSNDRVVAVPLFFAHNPTTQEQIPAKLELDRGGIAYADPLRTHERVTDALQNAIETRRTTPESELATSDDTVQAVATDGNGRIE